MASYYNPSAAYGSLSAASMAAAAAAAQQSAAAMSAGLTAPAQVVSSMDAMKYSMEADKYRSPYMPSSSLAISMYSDPKYMDSPSKSYLERGYLDSTSALTKAYFESSKMYMDANKYNPDSSRSYPGLDIGKMYSDHQHLQNQQASLSSPRSSDSPDVKNNQERLEGTSSSSSTTTSSAGASPGNLQGYYPTAAIQQGNGGLLPMSQYAGQYPSQSPGTEFRRPLTVLF
ncbi:hypothetical protein JTB14_035881 [Gonioctena quinquepunctata]|nr:hypothetical protein JTB14_035881 [Gonioctena quinquepunctata]